MSAIKRALRTLRTVQRSRKAVIAVVSGMLALVALGVSAHVVISAVEQRVVEREALTVAEIVATQALAAQEAYGGAHREARERAGEGAASDLLPPIEFIGLVAERSHALGGRDYSYRWLGVQPDDAAPLDDTESAPAAFWQIDDSSDGRTLRYVLPVALATACYGCEEIVNAIHAPGAADLPERMALEIRVPLDNAAAFAAVQSRSAESLIVVVGAIGLIVVSVLAMKSARNQRRLARRYEQLANIDSLTGLCNRLAAERRMARAIKTCIETGVGMGAMFVDIDHFKNINDSLGHAVGDAVIREAAERMAGALRDQDLIARYSGDEFLILAPGTTDAADLAVVAHKLLKAVHPPIEAGGDEIFVTVSIGIAHYPTDGPDVETLLKHADLAMYRAKEMGRNGFQFFAREMNAAATERLHMTSSLWQGLRRNEFVVHYQPQTMVSDPGRILGLEALVRWNHPTRGMLAPGRFISHAESNGAVEPLGEWVLREALTQARRWRDDSLFEGTIAVNLSMRQLYNPALASAVTKILAETGITPDKLEFEITESMVSTNPDAAVRTLADLRRVGVSVALDDFGTGQSSLAHLLSFPINTLKIDRTFTADVPDRDEACAIVRAIIALAKSLRIRVVAEGVETDAQRRFLQVEGCDEVQGYLTGKPMTREEVSDVLARGKTGARASAPVRDDFDWAIYPSPGPAAD
jgi:diguanylate cyclase (GGDEF)-like protein